ncbi:MAG: hypothetical protein IPK85_02500 [Gemmatimonadetes bacterium]|nr:hypothetical protein [Gemmatimonadota bacterium]
MAVSIISLRPGSVVSSPGTMDWRNWRSASDMAPGIPAPPAGLRSVNAISLESALAASACATSAALPKIVGALSPRTVRRPFCNSIKRRRVFAGLDAFKKLVEAVKTGVAARRLRCARLNFHPGLGVGLRQFDVEGRLGLVVDIDRGPATDTFGVLPAEFLR